MLSAIPKWDLLVKGVLEFYLNLHLILPFKDFSYFDLFNKLLCINFVWFWVFGFGIGFKPWNRHTFNVEFSF
jgi:hypothetical protein